MALVYIVNKPKLLGSIVKLLLLFFAYDVIMVYKPKCSHLFANAMSLLPHSTKLTDAVVFSLQPLWLNGVEENMLIMG
jgi:hypothetical protein